MNLNKFTTIVLSYILLLCTKYILAFKFKYADALLDQTLAGLTAVCSAMGSFLGSVEIRAMAAHHLAALSDTVLVLSRALHLMYYINHKIHNLISLDNLHILF